MISSQIRQTAETHPITKDILTFENFGAFRDRFAPFHPRGPSMDQNSRSTVPATYHRGPAENTLCTASKGYHFHSSDTFSRQIPVFSASAKGLVPRAFEGAGDASSWEQNADTAACLLTKIEGGYSPASRQEALKGEYVLFATE